MTKQEFLRELENGLSGLPKAEINEYIGFYSEMIDDYIEDGFSEEDAVAAAGSVEKIAEDIIADTPITKLAKEKIKPKRRIKAWEIVALVLGSPIWLSILIALFAVVLSIYVSLWAVVICLWVVFAALVACALGLIAGGGIMVAISNKYAGVISVAAGLVCAGLSIFAFFGCKFVTKGFLKMTKKVVLGLKKALIKEGA